MIRRIIVLQAIMSLIIAGGCHKDEAHTYYISPNGADSNNGLSPSKAWKTVSKVNSRTLYPGDSILFEAEGEWREQLLIKYSGTQSRHLIFSRYGKGRNPRILGSDNVKSWAQAELKNIWVTNGDFTNPRPFLLRKYAGNIFFEQKADVSWGRYRPYDENLSGLKEEFDWTWNDNKVYVYSESDPGATYNSIEINQRKFCISIDDRRSKEYIDISGIDMFYSRLAGLQAGYDENSQIDYLVVSDCHIGFIGEKGSGYAYGIEAANSNLIIERCEINDCGRRGISLNLYSRLSRIIENIKIRDNYFYNGFHTTSLDLASMDRCIGSIIREVYFYNNIIDDSDIIPIVGYHRSNQLFIQEGGAYLNNIYIFNNLFVHATGRNILIEGSDSIFIWNNTIIGHNPGIIDHPYANVALNHTLNVDFRNNLIYDNLPDNNIENQGVMMYHIPGKFINRDYNLYYSLNPKGNRNFACHRLNNSQDLPIGYWSTIEWVAYISDNPSFEQHSPVPSDPLFEDEQSGQFYLTESSPACRAGSPIALVTTDLNGFPRNTLSPSIGAFEIGSVPTPSSPLNRYNKKVSNPQLFLLLE